MKEINLKNKNLRELDFEFIALSWYIPFCLKYREEKVNPEGWTTLDKILSKRTNIKDYNKDKSIKSYSYEAVTAGQPEAYEQKLELKEELSSQEIYSLIKMLNEEVGPISELMLRDHLSKIRGETTDKLDEQKKSYNNFLGKMTHVAEKYYFPLLVFLLEHSVERVKNETIIKAIPKEERFKMWFGEKASEVLKIIGDSGKEPVSYMEAVLSVIQKFRKEGKDWSAYQKQVLYKKRMEQFEIALHWTTWYIIFDYLNKKDADFYNYFSGEFIAWLQVLRWDYSQDQEFVLKPALKEIYKIEKGDILCSLFRKVDSKKIDAELKNELTCKFIDEMRTLCRQKKSTKTLLYSSLFELEEIIKIVRGIEKHWNQIIRVSEENRRRSSILQVRGTLRDTAQIIYLHSIEVIQEFDPTISKGDFYKYFRKMVGGKTASSCRSQAFKMIDREKISYVEDAPEQVDEETPVEQLDYVAIRKFISGFQNIKMLVEQQDTISQIVSVLESQKLTSKERDVMKIVMAHPILKTKDLHKQIAEELNMSVGDVRIVKMRALEKIRNLMR